MKYVDVGLSLDAKDTCDPMPTATISVYSDEAELKPCLTSPRVSHGKRMGMMSAYLMNAHSPLRYGSQLVTQ